MPGARTAVRVVAKWSRKRKAQATSNQTVVVQQYFPPAQSAALAAELAGARVVARLTERGI